MFPSIASSNGIVDARKARLTLNLDVLILNKEWYPLC